jgi:hypothetical protein
LKRVPYDISVGAILAALIPDRLRARIGFLWLLPSPIPRLRDLPDPAG